MNKINLFWAVVWTCMCVFCAVGYFWNPSHIFTAVFSGIFAGMFWDDYRKNKGK